MFGLDKGITDLIVFLICAIMMGGAIIYILFFRTDHLLEEYEKGS